MTKKRMRLSGLEATPENIQGIGGTDLTREGEIATDSSDSELKVRLGAATRTVVTENQAQVLTNKTTDADLNTITNLEVDNLKSGVLNVSTSLVGASNLQLPSALAVKTYVDSGLALQNEASEISVVPAGTIAATNVQAAIVELDGDIQGHINDTIDAHDASAISIIPTGNLVATQVQSALVELQTDIDNFNSSAVTLTNKSLDDATVSFVDTIDSTKKISFDAVGTTSTKTTITSSQTANRIITLPDATDTLVGKATIDTLTNKTLTSPVINTPTGIVKADVGLGNVDNTSDATKNADIVALTNKTINADLNTITNIENADIKVGAAIDRSKLASGTNNALVANNGSGVLSDVSGISVSAFGLSVSPSKNFSLELVNDATTTGINASVTAFAGSALTFSNVGLTSIANIPAGSNGQELIIVNRVGSSVSIKDQSGAIGIISARIYTGTGADITLAANAALFLTYDSTAARWQIIGGSGGGTLVGLTDVTIATPLENQVLTYDSVTSTWINQANTLQQVYENSATTEITTNITNGAVDLKRGSASDSDDVLRILNNAGVVVSQTNALGQHNTMYSSPENMLKNGSLELPSIADWTCTVGTCTRTTTSGEYSHGTAALKVALSAQAMNVSQTVNTPSGIQKQGFARVIYKVPSTMTDFQICTLVDAAEQTCVPTANLVLDNTFRSIEIPLVFGSTSAGIKFKTTSAFTADAFFDGAILAQGLGLQNLMLDHTYNAAVTTTSGAIQQGNKSGWIASCTAANPTVCSFRSGEFTVAPNCVVSQYTNNAAVFVLQSLTATTIQIGSYSSTAGTALASQQAGIICQKSGNDYLASSSQVYSQASGNYSRRAYTPTFTGFGTPTAISCYESRDGEFLDIDCKFTGGTSTAEEARVSLPVGLVSSASGALRVVGVGAITVSAQVSQYVLIEPSVSYFTFGSQSASTASLSKVNGSSFLSLGTAFSFTARIPISGWSNSSSIVGVFSDMIPKIATLTDIKASGTVAGALTANTWNTRTLNTKSDPDSIVTSLTANQFTLPTGTYYIEALVPSYNQNYCKVKLRNITTSTDQIVGQNGYTYLTSGTLSIIGHVTITSPTTFEIQHNASISNGTGDGGISNTGFGAEERYTQVKITKIK